MRALWFAKHDISIRLFGKERLSTSRYGIRCPASLFNVPPLRGQGLRPPAGERSPGLGGGASSKAGQRISYLEVERRSFPKGLEGVVLGRGGRGRRPQRGESLRRGLGFS